jgi:deoxyribonuclease V
MLYFLQKLQELIVRDLEILHLDFDKVEKVAFFDCGFKKDLIKCACIIYNWKKREKESEIIKKDKVYFPYIPTYLFIREAPIIFEILKEIEVDLIVIDGQGLAHPRKAGIATIVGILAKKPSIGIAKSYLFGEIKSNEIYVNGNKVGIKFGNYLISIGNKVDFENLKEFLEHFNFEYPWPLKEADELSKF